MGGPTLLPWDASVPLSPSNAPSAVDHRDLGALAHWAPRLCLLEFAMQCLLDGPSLWCLGRVRKVLEAATGRVGVTFPATSCCLHIMANSATSTTWNQATITHLHIKFSKTDTSPTASRDRRHAIVQSVTLPTWPAGLSLLSLQPGGSMSPLKEGVPPCFLETLESTLVVWRIFLQTFLKSFNTHL